MVAQNHCLEIPIQEENHESWREEFADEETLSLCDMVISSDSNEYWNGNSPSSDHHQDFFEFFSQDFPAATSTFLENENNIIFCGKLIPHKDQEPNVELEQKQSQSQESKIMNKKEENDDDQAMKNSTTTSCLFPWKNMSHSFNKSRTYPPRRPSKGKTLRKSMSLPLEDSDSKDGNGCDDKFDFSVKKVSILTTPVKSRWHLFAFGRFPMEIELKDMKLRQIRKNKAMMTVQADNGDGGKKSGKGLWRLIKVLGWRSKEIKQVDY